MSIGSLRSREGRQGIGMRLGRRKSQLKDARPTLEREESEETISGSNPMAVHHDRPNPAKPSLQRLGSSEDVFISGSNPLFGGTAPTKAPPPVGLYPCMPRRAARPGHPPAPLPVLMACSRHPAPRPSEGCSGGMKRKTGPCSGSNSMMGPPCPATLRSRTRT